MKFCTGDLSVNMAHMHKFKVTSDNVALYENIMKSKGQFFTFNADVYIELFNEFNIFYTFKKA